MKFLIVICLIISGFSFSQDKNREAKVINSSEFQANKSSGDFVFQFPKDAQKETVEKNAAKYAKYFSVDFNDRSKVVNLKMIENNESSRHIIKRFMIANDISEIQFEGKKLQLSEFYEQYLK